MKYNTLKLTLVKNEISQTELANRLGDSKAAVNALCANRSQPSLKKLYRIADLLNTEPYELILSLSEYRQQLEPNREEKPTVSREEKPTTSREEVTHEPLKEMVSHEPLKEMVSHEPLKEMVHEPLEEITPKRAKKRNANKPTEEIKGQTKLNLETEE